MKKYIVYIIALIFWLMQIFLVDPLASWSGVTPCLYIFLILKFPILKNKSWIYITSFLLGLSIDLFGNTLGIHAVSCLLTAGFRNIFLEKMLTKDRRKGVPRIKWMDQTDFIFYIILCSTFFHICLYLIQTAGLGNIWKNTILCVVSSFICFIFLYWVEPSRFRRQ